MSGSCDEITEELKSLPDGSVVSIGCRNCEGIEEHKKVGKVTICLNCNYESEI